jgi:DNA-binding transcriptional MerR regulator/effector-binding domain-containing protein
MAELLPIGMFSRAVLISPKTLRDYHETGLLTPAVVDPRTGYRGYRPTQIGEAAVIRELRALDVPLAEIARVLAARDPEVTRVVLAEHRDRMREQAERVARIADTLDGLLTDPGSVTRLAVVERERPALPVMAMSAWVAESQFAPFLDVAYPRLYGFLAARSVQPAGPGGGLYPGDYFSDEPVEVTAFVPVDPLLDGDGEVEPRVLPAGRVAVATFTGPYDELAAAYRAVGGWLAGKHLTTDGPLIETYLVGPDSGLPESEYRTEIAWPVRGEGAAA